ncbi:single-stranded DNA-binding protein [Anaeromyxobacter oryzisoli]|uniref:single-stranded DNA-binding protein n=1 Tax=Anaeromyxobacter oryzisoli TaxID=2925408 RepID=UPI001F55EA60|nr:single-stranded DNA-binding protein [Anaeromyxobacter sp. SG63]
MVNKVILVGNLGRDPEVRQVGGQTVAILRLATSRSWVDKKGGDRKQEREWHDVEVWGRHGELCGHYLAKGRQVYVAGRLKTDRWKDKQTGHDRERVKVVAELVEFLGGSDNHAPQGAAPSATRSVATAPPSPPVAGAVEEPPSPADEAPLPTPPPDLDDLERIP